MLRFRCRNMASIRNNFRQCSHQWKGARITARKLKCLKSKKSFRLPTSLLKSQLRGSMCAKTTSLVTIPAVQAATSQSPSWSRMTSRSVEKETEPTQSKSLFPKRWLQGLSRMLSSRSPNPSSRLISWARKRAKAKTTKTQSNLSITRMQSKSNLRFLSSRSPHLRDHKSIRCPHPPTSCSIFPTKLRFLSAANPPSAVSTSRTSNTSKLCKILTTCSTQRTATKWVQGQSCVRVQ